MKRNRTRRRRARSKRKRGGFTLASVASKVLFSLASMPTKLFSAFSTEYARNARMDKMNKRERIPVSVKKSDIHPKPAVVNHQQNKPKIFLIGNAFTRDYYDKIRINYEVERFDRQNHSSLLSNALAIYKNNHELKAFQGKFIDVYGCTIGSGMQNPTGFAVYILKIDETLSGKLSKIRELNISKGLIIVVQQNGMRILNFAIDVCKGEFSDTKTIQPLQNKYLSGVHHKILYPPNFLE